MEFHNYTTFKRRNKWASSIPGSSSEFREHSLAGLERGMPWAHRDKDRIVADYMSLLMEEEWAFHKRPFYNLWPPVLEMARSVDLRGVSVRDLRIPCGALLVRFPVSSGGVKWMLAIDSRCRTNHISEPGVCLLWSLSGGEEGLFHFVFEDMVSDYELLRDNGEPLDAAHQEMKCTVLRTMALLCLLGDDPRIIQPVVLAKDRHEYMVTKDEERKKLLELRSIRKQGLGFEIGREWHETHDTSPHFRNAHLCLFWTGKGRETPTVKLRTGCMVQPRKILEIPTGYLGPEDSEAELEAIAQ